MSKLFDDASLAMIPSAYKDGKLYSIRPTDGSGDFTFSRGSNLAATRVDVNGLIEKGRENLLLQSNQFDTTWDDSSVITLTSGQEDKDGGTSAWKLAKGAASSFLYQSITTSGVNTFSLYAKADTTNWIMLQVSAIASVRTFFDLSNGVLGSSLSNVINAEIESIGNGWYKCSFTYNGNAGAVRVFPADGNNDTSGTSGSIYIQDAQLEQGLVASDVISTTTTSVSAGILEDMPRLDYSGGASCPSLLLEPQRTNIITNSEYFESWSNSEILLDFGYLAPDGTNSAYKVTKNGTQAFLFLSGIGAVDDSRSIYARTTSGTGQVNLNSHNVNTNSLFTITEEWQRFEVTSTPSVALNYYAVDFRAGDLDEVILWGAQLEQGSYPTSYIPTYGTSQTRSNDLCVSSSLTTSTDFTIFFEAPNFCLINGSTGGSYDSIQFVFSGNGGPYVTNGSYHIYNNTLYYYNGSGNTGFGEIYNNQTDSKFVIMKRGDKVLIFANGAKKTEATLPSGGNVSTWDTINLTQSLEDGQKDVFGSTYKQLLKFDTALTDSECIALTTL